MHPEEPGKAIAGAEQMAAEAERMTAEVERMTAEVEQMAVGAEQMAAEAEQMAAEVVRKHKRSVHHRRGKKLNYHCTDYYNWDMS